MLKSVIFSFFLFFTFALGTLESEERASLNPPSKGKSDSPCGKGFRLTLSDWVHFIEKSISPFIKLSADEVPFELYSEAVDLFNTMIFTLERRGKANDFADAQMQEISQKVNSNERFTGQEIANIFFKSIENDFYLFFLFFQPSLEIVDTCGYTKEEFIQNQLPKEFVSLANLKNHCLSAIHFFYSTMNRSSYSRKMLNAFEALYGKAIDFPHSQNAKKADSQGTKWPLWFSFTFYSILGAFFLEVALASLILRKRIRSNSTEEKNFTY
jgi:hypothetical protein